MNLAEYLAERSAHVDRALDDVLPAAETQPRVLHEAMRYSVFSGGKRIRPVLCMAAAEAAGGSAEDALWPALALELLHAYTLIHDDLPCMDDDDMRRGKPSLHKAFGEANAVLAGDALQALAFEVAARPAPGERYEPVRIVTELAVAAGSHGVIGGQVEDLAAVDTDPDRETVEFIHLHKTADLFRASMRMGALAAGATRKTLAALTTYGTCLGLAFQITDDLLDAADAAPTDESAGELSCLSVFTESEAREQAAHFIHEARESLKGLDEQGTVPLTAIADFVLRRDS